MENKENKLVSEAKTSHTATGWWLPADHWSSELVINWLNKTVEWMESEARKLCGDTCELVLLAKAIEELCDANKEVMGECVDQKLRKKIFASVLEQSDYYRLHSGEEREVILDKFYEGTPLEQAFLNYFPVIGVEDHWRLQKALRRMCKDAREKSKEWDSSVEGGLIRKYDDTRFEEMTDGLKGLLEITDALTFTS